MKPPHSETRPTVVVIDDERDIRDALAGLVRSVGLQVALFSSPKEFLENPMKVDLGCLVLDVRLPGRSGLDLYDDLVKANAQLPVVFISGHADVAMSVRAMKAGAVEFLTKPIRPQDLLDAIQLAIERDHERRDYDLGTAEMRASFESLTPREREVMALVVVGRPNKEIAKRIGVALATVKLHRSQIMRKMGALSLPDLVRMADKLAAVRPKT